MLKTRMFYFKTKDGAIVSTEAKTVIQAIAFLSQLYGPEDELKFLPNYKEESFFAFPSLRK